MFNLTSDILNYLMQFNEYIDLISFTSTSKNTYIFRNFQMYIKIRNAYHNLPFSIRINRYTREEFIDSAQQFDNDDTYKSEKVIIDNDDDMYKSEKVIIDDNDVGYVSLCYNYSNRYYKKCDMARRYKF